MKEEDLTDKENMPNEGQNRSIKRRLSFKKYKLTKKKETNDENQFTASHKPKAEDKVLGDVTNVMSSRQEECWSMQNSMRNEYYGNKANEFIENKPQHRVITVKSKVLKSLQTVPRPLAPSTLHDVKNEKLMNSGIQIEEKKMNQSQVPQSKVEMKVQQELKESFSEIMKMSEKINENCLNQEPNTQITRPTLTTKTQPDLPIEKVPVPIQHKTPTNLAKDSDFCSAGKIFNNKLFNIFCHPSPKKEDDLEFREVESKYEIYPTEPEEIIQEEEISIGEWLSEIGLESLKLNFVDNGYANYDKFKKDYESCKAIFQDLLYRFGIDKIGHRARIAMKLKEGNSLLFPECKK